MTDEPLTGREMAETLQRDKQDGLRRLQAGQWAMQVATRTTEPLTVEDIERLVKFLHGFLKRE